MADEITTVGMDAVAFETRDGVAVAVHKAFEVDAQSGELLEARLQELLAQGKTPDFVWDLSRLQFISSIGITVALMFSRHVTQNGGRFCIAGLRGQCLNVMQVVGLTRVFDLYPGVEEALNALRVKRSGQGLYAQDRRAGGDDRSGTDRRKAQLPFEGPDRRSGGDRRSTVQRRQR